MSLGFPLNFCSPKTLGCSRERTALFGPRALSFAIATAGLLTPLLASAETLQPYPVCEREPNEGELRAAKGAYDAGKTAFKEADYARAILFWEEAFRRDCTAVKLLLNLAQVYELSGDKEHAVLALETYLERMPEAPDRAPIEKRVAKLRSALEADEAAALAEAETTPPAEAAPVDEPESQEPAAETRSQKKPLWPVIMTGAGVVTLGVGVPLTITGANDLQDVLDRWAVQGCAPGPGNCPENLVPIAEAEASGPRTRRNVGIGLMVGGGAVAAAGGVLWAVLWSNSNSDAAEGPALLDPRRTALVPVVTPGYQGLSLSGQF